MLKELSLDTLDVDRLKLNNSFESCVPLASEHATLHSGEILNLSEDQAKLSEILTKNNIAVPEGSRIDVYNPSIVFVHANCVYIAGRVELSGKLSEHESLVVFFKYENNHWIPQDLPVLKLQDPNITWVNNEMIVSGVSLARDEENESVVYRMAFYSGPNFEHLEPLAEGPWGMKGVRIGQLPNGKVCIYTRPQGDKGGLGNIGFTIVDSLADFKANAETIIAEAPLLHTSFMEGEWGGANQIIPVSTSENVIIGHVAYRDFEGIRHYYSCSFKHNYETGEVSKMKILATRANFPEGPAKADDLVDIVYSAGVVEINGEWFLLAGLSDTQAGAIKIEDPMLF